MQAHYLEPKNEEHMFNEYMYVSIECKYWCVPIGFILVGFKLSKVAL